ncbi:MAG: hypothetical protein OHM56_04590 [Spiroplasma phoeniceum]|nr:MAG: hypothetical protein OHM57_03990 [Spiroplasma phoeniceum]UZQ33222.1 MAG: hypothetical protein OHM56_04590 [Spiroplasma phoeniceum]
MINPPEKVKIKNEDVNNIISTQASSYFRRKDEFGNTVGSVQVEYNRLLAIPGFIIKILL